MCIPVSENGELNNFEGLVVRFLKSDGTNWVANFKPGWTELKGIYKLKISSNLLVIACGACYIMNPEATKPISVFGGAYETVFTTPDGQIVLGDDTGLTIIEKDNKYWHSDRISWDGLKVITVQGNLVKGLAFNLMHGFDEWVAFSFDLDSKILTGGSYEYETD
jgi:hypothetical protein